MTSTTSARTRQSATTTTKTSGKKRTARQSSLFNYGITSQSSKNDTSSYTKTTTITSVRQLLANEGLNPYEDEPLCNMKTFLATSQHDDEPNNKRQRLDHLQRLHPSSQLSLKELDQTIPWKTDLQWILKAYQVHQHKLVLSWFQWHVLHTSPMEVWVSVCRPCPALLGVLEKCTEESRNEWLKTIQDECSFKELASTYLPHVLSLHAFHPTSTQQSSWIRLWKRGLEHHEWSLLETCFKQYPAIRAHWESHPESMLPSQRLTWSQWTWIEQQLPLITDRSKWIQEWIRYTWTCMDTKAWTLWCKHEPPSEFTWFECWNAWMDGWVASPPSATWIERYLLVPNTAEEPPLWSKCLGRVWNERIRRDPPSSTSTSKSMELVVPSSPLEVVFRSWSHWEPLWKYLFQSLSQPHQQRWIRHQFEHAWMDVEWIDQQSSLYRCSEQPWRSWIPWDKFTISHWRALARCKHMVVLKIQDAPHLPSLSRLCHRYYPLLYQSSSLMTGLIQDKQLQHRVHGLVLQYLFGLQSQAEEEECCPSRT